MVSGSFDRFASGAFIAQLDQDAIAMTLGAAQRHMAQVRVVVSVLDAQRGVLQLWHGRQALGDNATELTNAHMRAASSVKKLQFRLLPLFGVSTAIDPFRDRVPEFSNVVSGRNLTILGNEHQRKCRVLKLEVVQETR